MNIYSIYKATNKTNGKCYIGFAVNYNKRIKQHKKFFNKKKTKFYDAIRSYGWNNFEWEIIYESKDSKHCLSVMEPFFIKQYDSIKFGYNMTEGGGGTLGLTMKGKIKHSDKTKLLLKELKTGTKHSQETKNKISNSLKGRQVSIKLLNRMKNDNPTKASEIVACPHCNKKGGYVALKRWHFNNCKTVV
jgi:group I intron endonuclease